MKPIPRRTFLRGAGACVTLPFLEAMMPRRAIGSLTPAGGPPLRMAILSVSGGTVLESWKPEQAGALTGELPSILRPFEFCKNDLTIVSGLSQNGKTQGDFNGHTSCAILHLTAPEVAKNEGGKYIAGTSVDQFIAQKIGKETYLPSLEIGLGKGETRYSYADDGQPVPYEGNPKMVFDRMFRGRKPEIPNWGSSGARNAAAAPVQQTVTETKQSSLGQSVLDLVLDEAKALKQQLGYEDQQRLGNYMDSVRSVEKRVQYLTVRQESAIAEAGPPQPVSDHHGGLIMPDMDGDVWSDDRGISTDPELHMEYIRTMTDLMVLAFQTNTTRLVTFAIGAEGFMFPGIVTVGYEHHYHTLQHQGNARTVEEADPISREACRQINAWYASLIAEAVAKMKSIDEGGTSLLDNSMILYTSYMANGGHQKHDYPCALIGKAKGTLPGGQHIACEAKTPVSNLYVEMINRMGIETDTFGDNKADYGKHGGRIPGLS